MQSLKPTYLSNSEKIKCSGCTACYSICPKQAINMIEDNEGFVYPLIDQNKCINCSLCEKVCPVINYNSANEKRPINYNLLIGKNKRTYYKSATAGVCTSTSKIFIQEGGIIFGAKLDENIWNVQHICISKLEDLKYIRNSKYAQSFIGDSFVKIKNELKNKTKILFIGTPCQIAGLKAFLRKNYENLYTIDLICHGVFSHKLLKKEVSYWENLLSGKLFNYQFRSKKIYPWSQGGVVNFDIIDSLGKKKHYECLGSQSPTYRCYAYSGDGLFYNLRPICYTCPFRDRNRYGDLTIGDSWGIREKYPNLFTDKNSQRGISLVITNTDKGKQLLSILKDIFIQLEIKENDAFAQPALLPTNRDIPIQRNDLYQLINKDTYASIINKILKIDIESISKNGIKQSLITKRTNRKILFAKIIRDITLINLFNTIKSKLWHIKENYKPGIQWWLTNNVISNLPSKRLRLWGIRKMGLKASPMIRIYAGVHIRSPKNIKIEDGVSIGPKVLLDGRKGLTIGKNAVIAYEAIIWTLNHDYNDIHFCSKGAPVNIGAYAWICSRSIILPGINIGEGAIVASGAIVTKDVPPYSIVAGIPAKVIGLREKKEYDYGYKANIKTDHCS